MPLSAFPVPLLFTATPASTNSLVPLARAATSITNYSACHPAQRILLLSTRPLIPVTIVRQTARPAPSPPATMWSVLLALAAFWMRGAACKFARVWALCLTDLYAVDVILIV